MTFIIHSNLLIRVLIEHSPKPALAKVYNDILCALAGQKEVVIPNLSPIASVPFCTLNCRILHTKKLHGILDLDSIVLDCIGSSHICMPGRSQQMQIL